MSDAHDPAKGLPIIGNLHTADASLGVRLPIQQEDSLAAKTLTLEAGTTAGDKREHLALVALSLTSAAGGDCSVFFDSADCGDRFVIDAADDGAGTFVIDGDWADFFAVGTDFLVSDSTGNDGEYTVTAVAYAPSTDKTTITVAAVADGTDDGEISLVYQAVAAVSAVNNTFGLTGDFLTTYPVGRQFTVSGSTGNDGDYTVTAVSLAAGVTTITVASVADATVDGFLIAWPDPTIDAGTVVVRGTYAVTAGENKLWIEPHLRRGPDGYDLFVIAPAGVTDVQARGVIRQAITKASRAAGVPIEDPH